MNKQATTSLPLYSKIALWITLVGVLISLGLGALALWSSDRYHQEVTQRLHKNLAQYVLDHLSKPLFDMSSAKGGAQPEVNKDVLKSIAINTMMINPAVEVYLLDSKGKVLGHALPEANVDAHSVKLEPITSYLEQGQERLVLGDNPRSQNKQSIFSVALIEHDGVKLGYLYVVLASHEAESLAQQLAESHVVRLTLGASVALILLFVFVALMAFSRFTQPLQTLSAQLRTYRQSKLEEFEHLEQSDEMAELALTIELMQERIQSQFDQLGEADRLRRELISNVSHDLRTPLASMQGYLETLILKAKELDETDREKYLHIAHRHSRKLNELIGQLFELSKLDAGRVEPEIEIFSLSELLYDVKQGYELLAQEKNISLEVNVPEDNALVSADISLIQRVLQNLIDNAFKHTPGGGHVALNLYLENEEVAIRVSDSGVGIRKEDLPFVFERFYQANDRRESEDDAKAKMSGAGLGLSIVKKILDLHGSIIRVSSTPDQGTCFSFMLPRPVG